MDFVIFHICISKNSLYISWVVLPVKTQIYVFVYVSFIFFTFRWLCIESHMTNSWGRLPNSNHKTITTVCNKEAENWISFPSVNVVEVTASGKTGFALLWLSSGWLILNDHSPMWFYRVLHIQRREVSWQAMGLRAAHWLIAMVHIGIFTLQTRI